MMRSALPLFQVDAFTDRPFGGNPAAVCLLRQAADADWMQSVAAEMNLSETAFVWPVSDGFGLRWFTPRVEVDLCGHATLAAAHVLWQEDWLAPDSTARFFSNSGLLTASRLNDWVVLDFPATPAVPAEAPPGLLPALGLARAEVFSNGVDFLVLVGDAAGLPALQPDLAGLAAVEARGIIVTAATGVAEPDFVSRFFAPAVGIDEDPVTGSAHCTLAPFWAERLGKAEFRARQVSRCGGELRVSLHGDRVRIAGQAVTVLRGSLQAV